MKKKILVLHPVIAPYRIDFFNSLSKTFDTTICLFRRRLLSQNFNYDEIERQFEFKPSYIMMDEMTIFKWISGIWHMLSKQKPDIVLTSEFNIPTIISVLYKLLFRHSMKIVPMVDDSYNMVAEGNQLSWKHSIATRILMPFVDDVINVEPRVRDYYQNKYKKGLYFPIIYDDDKYREKLKRVMPISEQYVHHYHLEGKKVLLFVGRLVPYKNILMAIRAYRLIANSNTAFVIVGDGELRESVIAGVEGCDNIYYVGRMEGDELYAWYNIAQVFILPSLLEPFGAVTNEALLGGCFALISNRAGSQCLVKNGVNGFIIDPENEKLMAQIIERAFARTDNSSLPLALRQNAMKNPYKILFQCLVNELKK